MTRFSLTHSHPQRSDAFPPTPRCAGHAVIIGCGGVPGPIFAASARLARGSRLNADGPDSSSLGAQRLSFPKPLSLGSVCLWRANRGIALTRPTAGARCGFSVGAPQAKRGAVASVRATSAARRTARAGDMACLSREPLSFLGRVIPGGAA